jgi:hypothetical protein
MLKTNHSRRRTSTPVRNKAKHRTGRQTPPHRARNTKVQNEANPTNGQFGQSLNHGTMVLHSF